MNCDEARERIIDWRDETPDVTAHLAACETCREEARIWQRLGEMPDPKPSRHLRRRFNEMLEDHIRAGSRPRAWFHWRPVFQVAAAVAIAIGGWAVGRSGQKQPEMVQLREEVRTLREVVALSLLQQSSASERLRGINYTQRIQADSDVRTALLEALRGDPNVDVRLAALDALRRFSSEPAVRAGFVDALRPDQSPLVQIALIDSLAELKERRAAEAIQKIAADAETNTVVKQRAARVVEQLRRQAIL